MLSNGSPFRELYIGLMSGTSLDGVDAVLVDFSQHPPLLLAHHYTPYGPDLRQRLTGLCADRKVDMQILGESGVALGRLYAECCNAVIQGAGVGPEQVSAIGCHGQTIRHAPGGAYPFTMQIGEASVVAEHTSVKVVSQFRQRDMAAGGQGAPLVPPFHRFVFGSAAESRVILNLGGIANITWLPRNSDEILGFDTGPANVLIDSWCQRHSTYAYDCGGRLARQGKLIEPLFRLMQAHPFFSSAPPKSTGRETFHLQWVDSLVSQTGMTPAFNDMLHTLTELTAWSVADAVAQLESPPNRLIACGGGAFNEFLMDRLAARLPATQVTSCSEMGVQPDHIEAMAFAWLARQTIQGEPGNHPQVTGAKGYRVLGGIYPG